jgi:hypothetical protein
MLWTRARVLIPLCAYAFDGLTYMYLMLVYINYISYLKWQLP